MKHHLKLIHQGHWDSKGVQVSDSDEFQDLIETYNHFYTSLHADLRQDLHRLKKIQVNPLDKDSENTWRELIEEKEAKLNRLKTLPEANDSFEESELSLSSRRSS